MNGTLAARRTHYDILGVSPTAAEDEIARAFAREGSVFRPHAVGHLAEVCIAYETLSDPAKRRAYDASIGINRQPAVSSIPAGARHALVAQGPAPTTPIEREPSQCKTAPPARRALPLGPGPEAHASPQPRFVRGNAPQLVLEEELGVEARPIDWRRAGVALGTVVVAACALGGLAGWWSSGGIAAQPENIVSVELPPAKPSQAASTEEAAGPVTKIAEAAIDRPKPAIAPAAPIDPPVAAEPASVEERPAEVGRAAGPVEQTSQQASPASPALAAMPLPDRVVARTIQRIGYSCGSVSATVPVEGEAPGVFKVTCSSGQSYQAKPVNGRYHFRRWDRR